MSRLDFGTTTHYTDIVTLHDQGGRQGHRPYGCFPVLAYYGTKPHILLLLSRQTGAFDPFQLKVGPDVSTKNSVILFLVHRVVGSMDNCRGTQA